MYKYASVIEHNSRESWKAEKQFTFPCTRKPATEFPFPFHFSYPQWLSASFLISLYHPYHQFSCPCHHGNFPACVTTDCACLNGHAELAPRHPMKALWGGFVFGLLEPHVH